jgi:hypothetical protein
MNDIDFDELDKAVNSLVTKKGGGPSQNIQPAAAQNVTFSRQPAEPVTAAVQKPEPRVTDEPADPTAATKVTVGVHSSRLAPKHFSSDVSKGGFIDIMAPKLAKKPSRVGPTIQPTSPVVPEQTEAVVPASSPTSPVEPKNEPIKQPTVEPLAPKKDAASEVAWPDPLDFHNANAQQKAGKSEPAALKTEPQTEPTEPEAPEPEPRPAEATSPFIPGAKVQKRPLGAYAEKSVETLAQPAAALSEDIAEEESAVVTGNGQPEKADKPEEQPDKTEGEEKPSEQQLHETAMMSIPQQYHAKQKADDQSSRPVFDTKEYHPPLLEETAQAAHKGGFWGRFFLTLFVLALLAAGSYFGFIYFVQNF